MARVTSGLTLQGAASWNQSRQTNSPALIDNNPASANYGKPITQDCSAVGTGCTPVTNPFGPIGAPSADAPPIQFSVRARYEWSIAGYSPFVQAGATHSGISFTQAGSNPTIAGPAAISTGRAAVRESRLTRLSTPRSASPRMPGTFNVYGENLGNSNASTFISTDQFIVAQTPLRPRVLGAVVRLQVLKARGAPVLPARLGRGRAGACLLSPRTARTDSHQGP